MFTLDACPATASNGPLLDIMPRTPSFSTFGLGRPAQRQGKLIPYMPGFVGTPDEREALAAYVAEGLHGKKRPTSPMPSRSMKPRSRPLTRATAEYVLLAWNNLGMHCISDSDPYFVILPPANDLWAQLVRRGDPPAVVAEGIRLEYKVEAGFENPSAHVRFWEFAPRNFGAEVPVNVGLGGKGMSGEMEFKSELGSFPLIWCRWSLSRRWQLQSLSAVRDYGR
jgi:hypothetical protein